MRRVALVGLLLLGACGEVFEVTRPPGFVALDHQDGWGYDYRATTAEGVVLAVRAIDNDPRGDAAFWNKAITDRVHGLGGYARLGTRPVTCKSGLAGTQHRFGHDDGPTPHLYVVTVFVTDERIFLLEAGGERTQVEGSAAALDAFVASFRPR